MDLLLGLDVGTTATKALLFDREGSIAASASRQYGLVTPNDTWVEQNPEDLWDGVVETTRAVLEGLRPEDRVVALSQSSQAGTTIPVDDAGEPVYNAISWMDNRGTEQAGQIRQEVGADFIRRTTGWPLYEGLPLQHIGWLRDNRPDVFEATRRFLFVNDFIGYRLTGELCMNPSDASITQLLNVATADWDERLLSLVGIRREQLSPVRPSGSIVGRISAQASEATGLSRDVLVVSGAHDQYCAAVGLGVTEPGLMMLSCGTAWVLLAVPEGLEVGLDSGMAVSCHAVPDRWGAIQSLGGVGTSLEWFIDNIWVGRGAGENRDLLYREINEAAAVSSVGAGGLLFHPLAGGHESTIGSGGGGFTGLTLRHRRTDMVRAVLEGVVYELRWAMEQIQAGGIGIGELKMVGGAARSPVWPQIVADITKVPVVLPAVSEAASLGAATLAGTGVGVFTSLEQSFPKLKGKETRLEPSADAMGVYDERYAEYRETGTGNKG
jgi:xylulokinase